MKRLALTLLPPIVLLGCTATVEPQNIYSEKSISDQAAIIERSPDFDGSIYFVAVNGVKTKCANTGCPRVARVAPGRVNLEFRSMQFVGATTAAQYETYEQNWSSFDAEANHRYLLFAPTTGADGKTLVLAWRDVGSQQPTSDIHSTDALARQRERTLQFVASFDGLDAASLAAWRFGMFAAGCKSLSPAASTQIDRAFSASKFSRIDVANQIKRRVTPTPTNGETEAFIRSRRESWIREMHENSERDLSQFCASLPNQIIEAEGSSHPSKRTSDRT